MSWRKHNEIISSNYQKKNYKFKPINLDAGARACPLADPDHTPRLGQLGCPKEKNGEIEEFQ